MLAKPLNHKLLHCRPASMKAITLVLCIFVSCLPLPALGADYPISVDEYDKPLSWSFNNTGGDRGVLNAEDIDYVWNGSAYTATALNAQVPLGGMWYSLIGINQDNLPLDFKAIFGPYVKAEYQGEISEVELVVNSALSPSNNRNLSLKLELKDINNGLICSETWANLTAQSLPKQYVWTLPESCKQAVEVVVWAMDRAQPGDSVTIDRLRLKAKTPDMPTSDQAFLWSFSSLMSNYDPATHMVQDRTNFHRGDSENVSATGKTAKVAYYANKKGYMTSDQATQIITGIADTLLINVPRGPVGINTLWPHFTRNGGTVKDPPTEWASGDTVYAALDIITALQLIGDPRGQLPALESFLTDIDWQALLSAGNNIAHGYDKDGNLFPHAWTGFGMETAGVNLAYAAATGSIASMAEPPSDNGSGFIDNARYPIVFSGTDRRGNNWGEYRKSSADTQIGWYCAEGHLNPFLCGAGLFGLSAAENPEADTYVAYGTGGRTEPVDGDAEVIVLHYSGMISDIRPNEAKHVWEVLRDGSADFLSDQVVLSPLNNMESMRVDKTSGAVTVSRLKGSWNLALQAEGWAMADRGIKYETLAAVMENPFMGRGVDLLAPQLRFSYFLQYGLNEFLRLLKDNVFPRLMGHP